LQVGFIASRASKVGLFYSKRRNALYDMVGISWLFNKPVGSMPPEPVAACPANWGQKWLQKRFFGVRGILWTTLKESNARANISANSGRSYLLHGGKLRGVEIKANN